MSKKLFSLVFIVAVLVATMYVPQPVAAFHSSNHGYFKGRSESGAWLDVWQPAWRTWTGQPSDCAGGDGMAIPAGVNTADEFIAYVECKLAGNTRDRIGAAFIISTMIGEQGIGSDDVNPTSSEIAEFRARVRHAASKGWMQNVSRTCNPNSSSLPRNTFYQQNQQDVAWYYGCPLVASSPGGAYFYPSSYQAIVFYNGSREYIVARFCANPIGDMPVLEDNVEFNMSGTSRVNGQSSISVNPGQRISFTHSLTNGGPTTTSPTTINWTTQSATSSSGPWSNVTSSNAGTFSNGQTRSNLGNQDVDVAPNAPPGSQICRRITWNPDTHSGGSQSSSPACATVQYNFNLVPTIQIDTPSGSRTVQQGDQVTFRYRVDNTGTTISQQTNCSITGSQPSGIPGPPSTNCPRTFAAPGGAVDVTSSPQTITIGTQPAGSRICRTLTVTPATASGGPATSGEQCVVIAKTPYVHFMGGDVWAGGGFIQSDGTCATNQNAKITTLSNSGADAGSLAEYAAFALGEISRFGSGSRPLHNSTDFSALGRRLTFSNTTTTLGRFGAAQHCIDDYAAAYESYPSVGTGSVDLQTRPSGAWHSTGSISMRGTMQAGSRQVYLIDGNVTINGNIRYVSGSSTNPTYSSVSQIPSLVVIARGDIRIAAGVSDIAGVFISRGTFYTCYPKPSPPTINTCSTQLTVNGPVIANNVDLYRTFGGEGSTAAQRRAPAEIFNLSPETFLRNALNETANQSITTSSSRELPPRF